MMPEREQKSMEHMLSRLSCRDGVRFTMDAPPGALRHRFEIDPGIIKMFVQEAFGGPSVSSRRR